MNLNSTDFELFGIAPHFAIDLAVLDSRWLALQAKVHPDRFAAEGAAAQRVAMQWAVRVNEAYKRLKNPLQRAAYLCELKGVPIEAENNKAMPNDFLIQQMTWREALNDASTLVEVKALSDEMRAHRDISLSNLQNTIDEKHDFKAAAQQVRELMFVERFEVDLDRRSEALGQ